MAEKTHQQIRREERGAPETREQETRAHEVREFVPPSLLPDPPPQDGWRFKWVRTSFYGSSDNLNVSKKFRTGYTPVKIEDLEDFSVLCDVDSRWAKDGNIEVGGLMLCKIPEEVARSRDEYYDRAAQAAERAVTARYTQVSDPRMPVGVYEQRTRTSFGNRGGK